MNKLELDNYIHRMSDIRTLSSPQINEIDNAGDYSDRLRDNFRRIGVLAAENRKTLDEIIFPLAESDDPLTEEEIKIINEFNEDLVDTMSVENLDSAIMSILSDRLVKDASLKNDESYLVKELQKQVMVYHTFMYMTSRIYDQSISEHFREKALEATDKILAYLDHDRFITINDEAKECVLMITRFSATLWGSANGIKPEWADEYIKALLKALEVYEDPFYHSILPDYDWDYYIFRTREYFGSILDYTYRTKLSDDKLKIICENVKEQERLWQSDPQKYNEFSYHEMILISVYQALYLSGELTAPDYRDKLHELYLKRDKTKYDFDNLFVNIRCVLDTMISLDPDNISERSKNMLSQYYHDLCSYVFHMTNGGTLSELLELYTPVLTNFIEIPGKISFKEMCLRSLAALHPPTYVHSMMVAHISHCLCKHLLMVNPEVFIGMMGTKSLSDVDAQSDAILDFTYNAALCHDIGKLAIIDTVFIYGRKLLDFEFDVIKKHPDQGVEFMKKNESTRRYVDIARGHHRWYDNSRGYPEDFDTSKSEYKTIIDIVACADCMDAATDTIGRSYNQGKTLDDFEQELREGAGTRYAPYLAKLISSKKVREDINYLLTEGRNINYRNTYLLLSEIQKTAE